MKEQFQRLIELTDELLGSLQHARETGDLQEFNRLLEAREPLLKELHDRLKVHQNIEEFRQDYDGWRRKESELTELVKHSLLELQKKTNHLKNSQSVSRQYNSYLRQTPFGAFLDRKK